MKPLVTLLIVVGFFSNSFAQLGKKVTANGPITAAKTPAVNLNVVEMSLIANTNATSADLGGFNVTDKELGKNAFEANQILADANKMMIEKTIFGDNSPKNYGITYWSDPVLKLYNKHIAQKLAELIEANDDKYNSNNQGINEYIASKVADQLVLAATNNGAYVNTLLEKLKGGKLGPETLEMLRTKAKDKFKTETWTADYQQPNYFKDELLGIHYQMPFDYVTDESYGMKSVNSPANTRGFFFMAGPGANANCAIAVIIAKSQIETNKSNSKLTQLLQSAKWGSLYRPLLDYKNQSAFFDVHQVNLNWLQAITSSNQGAILFDKDNNCPSEMAYSIAQKIRSASVFNSAK